MEEFARLQRELRDAPSNPSHLSTLISIILGLTAPSPEPSLEESPHPTELHCTTCGTLLHNPITSLTGLTTCSSCLPFSSFFSPAPRSSPLPIFPFSEASEEGAPTTNFILNYLIRAVFPDQSKASKLREEAKGLLLASQKFDDVINVLEGAASLNPDDFGIYLLRAEAFAGLGRFQKALEDSRRALELAPFKRFPKVLRVLGDAHLALGSVIEALQHYCAYYHLLMDKEEKERVAKQLSSILSSIGQKGQLIELDLLVSGTQHILSFQEIGFKAVLAKEELQIKKALSGNQEMEDKMQCHLCMGIMYQPLTTPCGHSFCKICLLRNLDHRDVCPLCRHSLQKYLAVHQYNVTTSLDRFVQHHYHQGYQERVISAKAEEEEFNKMLPIFVCTLAFPGVRCPLHIFEPRYRLMIRRCIESGKNIFGMTSYVEDENGYGQYGTCLEIKGYWMFEDGRSNIETIGIKRFKVLERSFRDGYNVGRVEFIEDDPIPEERKAIIDQLVHDVRISFQKWKPYIRFPGLRQNNNGEEAEDAGTFSWWALSSLPISEESKYPFLKETSLEERLKRISQLCVALEASLRCDVM